jgi:hypothetical protein
VNQLTKRLTSIEAFVADEYTKKVPHTTKMQEQRRLDDWCREAEMGTMGTKMQNAVSGETMPF